MPLFSYHCTGCDTDFEALVLASEQASCPKCGGTALEQLLSRIAAEARTPGVVKRARAQAAKEGHFSNY
jgi:putative FmdB family regulatory protein